MKATLIKNCGLKDLEAIKAALASGADYIGFIHFPDSVRHISPEDVAAFNASIPDSLEKVAVTVNADDTYLQEIIDQYQPQLLQLHGDESPERVAEVKERFAVPVIKAIAVATAQDLAQAERYYDVADYLLFDTKLVDATVHGGSGKSFDWRLLEDIELDIPWFVSGGLNKENVSEALRISGAPAIDVSSGIELHKGVKDVTKIVAFNNAVQDYDRSR